MPDRLQELLHQRAAIQAHLAWLDREIAQLRPSSFPEPSATPVTPDKIGAIPAVSSSALPSTAHPAIPPADFDPDAILTRYQQDTVSLRTDVRKGCLLYFFGAFALLAIAIALFYFINTRFLRPASQSEPLEQNTPASTR